jgi:hypothetical protein
MIPPNAPDAVLRHSYYLAAVLTLNLRIMQTPLIICLDLSFPIGQLTGRWRWLCARQDGFHGQGWVWVPVHHGSPLVAGQASSTFAL